MEVSWVDSWLTGFKPAATYKSRHQWLSSACEPLLVTFFDYSLEHAMNMEYLAQQADEVGLKLEWTAGIPTWEPLGLAWHQKAVYRIQSTIKPVPPTEASKEDQRGCFHVADVYIRFPDGSLKRPDIAIFREEPPDTDDALTIVPAAVIEILSKGYEQKDTTIGSPANSFLCSPGNSG